jgi:hypothetical protein
MATKRKMRAISNGTLEKSGKSDVKAGRKGQLSGGIKPRKKYVVANFDVFYICFLYAILYIKANVCVCVCLYVQN